MFDEGTDARGDGEHPVGEVPPLLPRRPSHKDEDTREHQRQTRDRVNGLAPEPPDVQLTIGADRRELAVRLS